MKIFRDIMDYFKRKPKKSNAGHKQSVMTNVTDGGGLVQHQQGGRNINFNIIVNLTKEGGAQK